MASVLGAGSPARHHREVTYRTGPFVVRLTSRLRCVHDMLRWCYRDSMAPGHDGHVHFNVAMEAGSGLRRLLSAQAVFRVEDKEPFLPYPGDHAFPLLEWGINWCIATRGHQYLMLHAGVLERDGRALVLPAMPGSGKTTLTAALAFRGWRFLSDEFGLVSPGDGRIHPLPRAAPLKNASIDVIRRFAPEADIGRVYPRTRKGDVAHLRPPADSLARQHDTAEPAWIVFPRYIAGHPLQVRRLPKSLAFTRLAQNSFNYRLLGATGFDNLSALIRRCDCLSLEYGDLDAATLALDQLAGGAMP